MISTISNQTTHSSNHLHNNHHHHQQQDEHRKLFESAQQITGLYLLPFVSSFGILGNICNVLVYSHSKKYSTNVYLVALALSDIGKLVNDFIYFLITFIGRLDPMLSERLFSSLYLYSHYVFVVTAINTAWLTCVIAIDRYVIVSSRNQVKMSESNYFKSILISVVIMLASCVFALPSPLFLKAVDEIDPHTNKTVSKLAESDLASRAHMKRIYNYANVSVRAIIPLCLLIYLNIRIIKLMYASKLDRIRRMRRRSSSIYSAACRSKEAARSKITMMLVVIIFTFLVCVFPDAILTMMHLGYANENYLIRAIREVTDLLLAVNSASTAFICYYFSSQYRIKLKEIFASYLGKNVERETPGVTICGGGAGDEFSTHPVERLRFASQAFLNFNTNNKHLGTHI